MFSSSGSAFFVRRILLRALVLWALVRAGQFTLAVLASVPRPADSAPGSVVVAAGLVAAATWLDLRRRNLTILLPNLGVPVAAVLAAAAGIAIGAEVVMALVLG